MAGHYLRKHLRLARFARRLACFSGLLLVVAVVIFRRGGIDFSTLRILAALVAAFVALALALAGAGLWRVWRRGHAGGQAALAALFVGLLVATPFALAGALALGSPPTNMAETVGLAEAEGAVVAVPPEAVIEGRTFPVRASQVYQAVRTVLGDVGWTVAEVKTADPKPVPDEPEAATPAAPAPRFGQIPVPTPRIAPDEDETAEAPDPLDQPESGEYRVAAVAEGPVLRLPSDVEIRITEDEDQAYLDLRSVSRFGGRDFGQNRRFIETFLARVDTAMIGTVTPAAR
ncbi:hypothetical protein GCM10011390_36670 [Aureimonas endophytica]|uniref:DUF1499 domain-containing protein n=1 Tax=Aureimonas endophytica TaxID=2027858 RepID=A0A917EA66_9HYPH|nr:DUF1499 domain-containing protein [Aureimonas endophytica]GGE14150.1 hypothetical protein GCM10011390_36670 [Aureimonas endophytica]